MIHVLDHLKGGRKDVALWCKEHLLDLILAQSERCGFTYEPDLLIEGKFAWAPAGSISFLAMVVTPSPAVAIPLNWFKQHHFGPTIPKGVDEAKARDLIAMHHAAWSHCPDQVITPLDSAYAEWHGRAAGNVEANWSDYVKTLDEWHYQKWFNYHPFPCPEQTFYDTLRQFAQVRGFEDPELEIRRWINELKMHSGEFKAEPPSFLAEVRFGKITAPVVDEGVS